MNSALHIATVTTVLWNLLDAAVHDSAFETLSGITGALVTTRPPDEARTGNQDQLNLFLYDTRPNGAFRNAPLPGHVHAGEQGRAPLGLDLYYLLTAYGSGNEDRQAHRLLGRAMQTLHDHAVLGRAEIEAALAETTLHEQIERVRITPVPLSLEDQSRLWAAFQTEYRISVAYQVSPVLIESRTRTTAALPVLTRVVTAQPHLEPPVPTLRRILPPNGQPAARLGETITLQGFGLTDASTRVRFDTRRLAAPIELTPASATATTLTVALPNDAGAQTAWVAGLYEVDVVVTDAGGVERTSNAVPLALAPILSSITPDPAARAPDGSVDLTLGVRPQVRPEQRVRVLVGSRVITPDVLASSSATVDVTVPAAQAGTTAVRVRVDGVDSLVVDYAATPLAFDPSQTVTIT